MNTPNARRGDNRLKSIYQQGIKEDDEKGYREKPEQGSHPTKERLGRLSLSQKTAGKPKLDYTQIKNNPEKRNNQRVKTPPAAAPGYHPAKKGKQGGSTGQFGQRHSGGDNTEVNQRYTEK